MCIKWIFEKKQKRKIPLIKEFKSLYHNFANASNKIVNDSNNPVCRQLSFYFLSGCQWITIDPIFMKKNSLKW